MNILRKSSFLFIVSLLLIFSYSSVSAHEIFYDGLGPGWNPIPLKWADISNGKANLKINGSLLSSDYSSYYVTAKNAWPSASQKVVITESSFSTSNVDLSTSTKTAWDDMFGITSYSVLGLCKSTSTDGYELTSAENARASSGLIRYAAIYLTPYNNAFENSTQRIATMVHEIGHALGLGHPNTQYYPSIDPSIMIQGLKSYYTPQSHDINDLNSKY